MASLLNLLDITVTEANTTRYDKIVLISKKALPWRGNLHHAQIILTLHVGV